MTRNRIDAIEAAVERVTREQLIAKMSVALGVHPAFVGEPTKQLVWATRVYEAAVAPLLHALAEANERASLLQTAVHERCAERDEARRLLLSAFVAGAEYMAASSGSPSDPATVAAGGRWMSDNRTVLNPQQEGSRDHG